VRMKVGEASYHIHVSNPDGVNRGVKSIAVDGSELADRTVTLRSDGAHTVAVVLGR
jgi:cellobiose phosphorylase